MLATDYIATEERYGAHNYKPLDIVLARGRGIWVYDVDEHRYMDCLAGYSALNQGHCHPRIAHAAIEQMARITLTSRAFRNDQLAPLYERLHALTGYDTALPMNSGAEAVETAIKAARKWGYTRKGIAPNAAEIIVCANNFHGRTVTIVSGSTDAQYRAGFGPFTPGFRVVPFGDAHALRNAITSNTCAFLVEPIQGEAGIVLPPDGYLAEASQICRDAHVLLVADEIQSGLGRAGRLFAHMWEDVRPDAVIVGKALSGGFYPVSAVLSNREVLGVFAPGDHGSTFGGNPLACAIACAALDVIVDERLCERSETLGAYALERLRTVGRASPIVKDVRGRGLWIGIELDRPARPSCEALMREGLLCKETHDRVIRFSPPLVIMREDIDWAIDRFARVLGSR